MQAILDNYLVIIIIGLFLVFALIGYLIDMIKNKDISDNNIEVPKNIEPIEVTKIENNTNNADNDKDDLLKNYDDDTRKKL